MSRVLHLSFLLSSLALAGACSPTADSGHNSDKADSRVECPANADLNSAEGSQRRCVDTDSGRFVATECCAEVCTGAEWREQSNGTVCAWGDDPDAAGQTGRFAPRTCCDLNDALSCDVAETVGNACIDVARGVEVASACCEASPETCHPAVKNQLRDCADLLLEDAEFDTESLPLSNAEALSLCATEGDLQAVMLDGLCDSSPDSDFCTMPFEAFATDFVQACEVELSPEYTCVFGRAFWELSENPRLLFTDEAELGLAQARALDAQSQDQILQAMAETAADSDITLEEGFDFVDDNVVFRYEIWDGSNDLPFIAYEMGAGDNGFGAIFHGQTGKLVARIIDSDIYDGSDDPDIGCDIPMGPGWAPCSEDADCGGGLRCEGEADGHPTEGVLGKCVDATLGQGHPRDGADCTSDEQCSFEDGLLCSGLSIFESGFCRPAWMFGSFESGTSAAIEAGDVTEQDIFVSGLATVPEDARIQFHLNHSRMSDLNITVIPAGRDNASLATIFTGSTDATPGQTSLSIDTNVPHPGDEDVNGVWTLRIENTGTRAGSVSGYALQFSSRFD